VGKGKESPCHTASPARTAPRRVEISLGEGFKRAMLSFHAMGKKKENEKRTPPRPCPTPAAEKRRRK